MKYSLHYLKSDGKKGSVEALAQSITDLSSELSEVVRPKLLPPKENKESVRLLNLNNSKIYFYTQSYAGLNLYRMLNYAKPDIIFIQNRPDDFIVSPVSSDSLKEAQNKIKRPGQEIIIDHTSYKSTIPLLQKSGLYWRSGRINEVPTKSFAYYDRIHSITSLCAGMWSIHRGHKDLLLCDMPRYLLYRTLLNKYTLMQLQSMYSTIMKGIGSDPDLIPRGEDEYPIKVAYSLYPHVWSEISNNYMAKLIQEYSKSYKRIFCVLGKGHGELLSLCEKEIKDEGKIELRHKNVARDDISEMVVEKLALIDTFYFGDSLLKNALKHPSLVRAESFVDELVKEDRAAGNYTMSVEQIMKRKDYLLKLYLSMLKKYSDHGNMKLQEGKKELRTEFLKEVVSLF